jgi:hypothetical protein
MNRRQQTAAQALLRANEFAASRLPDFTHQPPTKVDLKVADARERLTRAITELGGKQAIQAGGVYAEETQRQSILRGDVLEELQDVNTTAAAIAEETANPALMNRFRMPYGSGAGALIATTRAMAAAIRELGLNDEFEAHGFSADTAATLDQLAADFELKEGEQGTALGDRVGATAAIPATLRAGGSAVKTLNAIFRRIYKGNHDVLAAWKSASHVQRAARPAPAPVTTPVIPPPPAP